MLSYHHHHHLRCHAVHGASVVTAGPTTNKRDYLDWFFDRITRDRVCPLPGDGRQMASVSRAEDVASMLAAVVGRENIARGKIYNCGTDKSEPPSQSQPCLCLSASLEEGGPPSVLWNECCLGRAGVSRWRCMRLAW